MYLIERFGPTKANLFSFSEQFQLLHRRFRFDHLFAGKKFHLPELFIRNTQNSDISGRRQISFDSKNMHLCILAAGTMPKINRKLKHCEAIAEQMLPKFGIYFTFLFRRRRHIEKNEHPHNTIFAKTIHHLIIG